MSDPTPLLHLHVASQADAVASHGVARLIGGKLGLATLRQTQFATAVSMISRDAVLRARLAQVDFSLDRSATPELVVIISEEPGLSSEDHGLADRGGPYPAGLMAARALVDRCETSSGPGGGARVALYESLPRRITSGLMASIEQELRDRRFDLFDEVWEQNQELLSALDAVAERQDELTRMTDELEDTNRGMVALFAQMDEQADRLRQANEVKNRFLSFISHEIRTPLASVIALARLLVDEVDGQLNEEQQRQSRLIYDSATSLNALVSDLLDIAKVRSGKMELSVSCFSVRSLVSSLKGMMRPLAANPAVLLHFDDVPADLQVWSDELRITQILRNFISNALKFTRTGSVEMSVQTSAADELVFAVKDTGIGIAPEDQERIFEEYAQISHPIQQNVRGTGLGLPLSRQLARLLGGRIDVWSEQGKGSTFSLVLPLSVCQPPH